MSAGDQTPEARLLELIRKPRSARTAAWKERAALRAGALRTAAAGVSPFAAARAALAVLCAVLAVLLAAALLRRPDAVADGLPAEDALSVPAPAAPGGVSLGNLLGRNPFRSLVAAPAPVEEKPVLPPAPPPPPKPPLSQRAGHLRLVGILGGSPLQAIVEDRRSQSTRYLSAGDAAAEDVTVEKVTAEKVILISGDERYELTL